ncbi:hypothetical protein AXG93_3507s1250 [Marchantia polymorpha subsp. ruderalis]|uniref:Uncharacterized protein n=1 Tax=Marchantia polymorpha subsp. ruderalis TaxID=1480154 RepID=A0A176VFM8_MARPO|nr:hypothetical protein AXG93_3507s1250 [Marchantia polymorpha subsp. ruderalis]
MASAKYGAFDSGSDYDGDGGLMLAGRRYCGRLHVPNWSFHYKARFQAHLSLGGGRAGAGVGGGAGGSSSGPYVYSVGCSPHLVHVHNILIGQQENSDASPRARGAYQAILHVSGALTATGNRDSAACAVMAGGS